MCGHFGIFKTSNKDNLDYWERDAFEQGLLVDMVRGMHGTGVARLRKDNKKVEVAKRAVDSYTFLQCKGMSELNYEPMETQALLGHNRKATEGSHIYDNTHPFQHGSLTLFHNGTLRSYHTLTQDKTSHFNTDSEVLTYALAKHGVASIIPETIGAFALVWHDKEDNSVSFLRNDERDFFFTTLDDGGIAYASEEHLLHWILTRNKVKYGTMYTTRPGDWLKFSLDDNPKSEWESKKVKLYTPRSYGRGSGNQAHLTHMPNRNNNTPRGSRSKRRLSKMLSQYGLKEKQVIELMADTFIPYNKGEGYGSIEGVCIESPWLPVKVTRCHKEQFKENGFLTAEVITVSKPQNSTEYYDATIIAENPHWMSDQAAEVKRASAKKRKPAEKVTTLPVTAKKTQQTMKRPTQSSIIDISGFEVIDSMNMKGNLSWFFRNVFNSGYDYEGSPSYDEEDLSAYNEEYIEGPNRILVSVDDFHKLTRQGCQGCQTNLEIEDAPRIVWVNNESPLCPECADLWTDPTKSLDFQSSKNMLS